jgi:LuxR family maltose regulon positive regulatory protein
MEAWKARGWLAQNRLDIASRWVEDRQLRFDHLPLSMQEHEYLAFVRILLAQGQLNEAILLLDNMLKAAESQKYTPRVIEVLMLKALALEAKNNTAEAITVLKRALTIAEPRGFFRIFLDEGPQLAQLLYKVIKDGYPQEYARQLLSGFQIPNLERVPRGKMQVYQDEFIEPLSKREIDVLKLIAEGLTNQEIAARLFLSLNTVKVHNRHIFSKLNTNSRLQAVSKARALGILSSTDD